MVAAPAEIDCDTDLERQYLKLWDEVPHGFTLPGRQILHCTFGSVLTNEKLGPLVADILRQHPDTYTDVLDDHFADIFKPCNQACNRKERRAMLKHQLIHPKINEVLGRAGHHSRVLSGW